MFQPDHNRESSHPSDATLLQFQQGTLLPEDWLEIQSHLAACGRCQMRLEELMSQGASQDAALVSLARTFAREGIVSSVPRVAPLPESFPAFEAIAAYLDGTLARSESDEFESLMGRLPGLAQEVETLRALKVQVQSAMESQPAETPHRPQNLEPAPTMIAQGVTETLAPKKVWWERWLWPLQTVGTTAVVALLLFTFGILPLKQELLSQRTQQSQRDARYQNQIAQTQSKNQRLLLQKQNRENRYRQQQRDLVAAHNQNTSLKGQLGQKSHENDLLRSQVARLDAAPPIQKPDAPAASENTTPAPLSSKPLLSDGNGLITRQGENYIRSETLSPEAAAVLRDGTLPFSPSLANLRSVATSSRGKVRFQVLSPVATRVRELRPELFWKRVPGATLYRVSVSDETAGEFIFESQPSTMPSWVMPQDLPRGHRFKWNVTALTNGRILAEAPQKPDLSARFEVLGEAEARAVETQLLTAGNSPLKRSLILAHAGLQAESQKTFKLLKKGTSENR